jgi:hypothetical protein
MIRCKWYLVKVKKTNVVSQTRFRNLQIFFKSTFSFKVYFEPLKVLVNFKALNVCPKLL